MGFVAFGPEVGCTEERSDAWEKFWIDDNTTTMCPQQCVSVQPLRLSSDNLHVNNTCRIDGNLNHHFCDLVSCLADWMAAFSSLELDDMALDGVDGYTIVPPYV